jgi:hypothetical protein
MERNLAIIFSSIKLRSSNKDSIVRLLQYKAGIDSIIRNLPNQTIKLIVDNTGYFYSNPKRVTEFISTHKDVYILSYENNSGISNKGLGELEMLESAARILDFSKYKKIFYLTGRYLYTQPYSMRIAIESNVNLVFCKPNFYGLDGQKRLDGDIEVLNDMFFCSDSEFMINYLDFYRLNKARMMKLGIPSERLLWEFHSSQKSNRNYSWEELESIGIVRTTSKRRYSIDEIQIL